MPDTDEPTLTVDVVVFQETVGETVIAPARLGSGDAREELSEFGADPDEVESLVRTLAVDETDDVPFIDVPPPASDDNPQGVYKIGEVDVNENGAAVSARFNEEVREHGHLGKSNIGTAAAVSDAGE